MHLAWSPKQFLDQIYLVLVAMSAAVKLLPFRAKVEERLAAKSQAGDQAKSSEPAAAPAKRQCTPYEKQLQKMEGDVSFIKDILWLYSDMVELSLS